MQFPPCPCCLIKTRERKWFRVNQDSYLCHCFIVPKMGHIREVKFERCSILGRCTYFTFRDGLSFHYSKLTYSQHRKPAVKKWKKSNTWLGVFSLVLLFFCWEIKKKSSFSTLVFFLWLRVWCRRLNTFLQLKHFNKVNLFRKSAFLTRDTCSDRWSVLQKPPEEFRN